VAARIACQSHIASPAPRSLRKERGGCAWGVDAHDRDCQHLSMHGVIFSECQKLKDWESLLRTANFG
jgi:hypothetical protein